MEKLNLEITIAADNNIPAFAGYVNYFGKDKSKKQPRIVVNFNAMFGALVENEDMGITFKEFFAENVVHEMLHMVQDIFGQAFDEDEVEKAILRCRKDIIAEKETPVMDWSTNYIRDIINPLLSAQELYLNQAELGEDETRTQEIGNLVEIAEERMNHLQGLLARAVQGGGA